jgi:hypothetical protein
MIKMLERLRDFLSYHQHYFRETFKSSLYGVDTLDFSNFVYASGKVLDLYYGKGTQEHDNHLAKAFENVALYSIKALQRTILFEAHLRTKSTT